MMGRGRDGEGLGGGGARRGMWKGWGEDVERMGRGYEGMGRGGARKDGEVMGRGRG